MSGTAGAPDGGPPGSPHSHPHGHDHHHDQTEVLPEPTGAGTVLVDIGGDIGAAAVRTPDSLAGEEIEIRPEPGEWTGRHVAVRPRPLPGRTIHAAFFESLVEGAYVVRVRFGPVGAVEVAFDVTGGQVTQVAWPE